MGFYDDRILPKLIDVACATKDAKLIPPWDKTRDFIDDAVCDSPKRGERKLGRCRRDGVRALPAAHFDLSTEVTLSIPYPRHQVLVQNRQVLESVGIGQLVLDDPRRLPDDLDPLRCGFADHARCQRRSGERRPLADLRR